MQQESDLYRGLLSTLLQALPSRQAQFPLEPQCVCIIEMKGRKEVYFLFEGCQTVPSAPLVYCVYHDNVRPTSLGKPKCYETTYRNLNNLLGHLDVNDPQNEMNVLLGGNMNVNWSEPSLQCLNYLYMPEQRKTRRDVDAFCADAPVLPTTADTWMSRLWGTFIRERYMYQGPAMPSF